MSAPALWHSRGLGACLLWPLSLLFAGLASLRRRWYRARPWRVYRAPVPVLVVGNVTVGGAGKTPLVMAILQALGERGLQVGVVSRGYGGQLGEHPVLVGAMHTAKDVGDEPKLIAERTGAAVCIARRRADAVAWLLDKHPIDVIVADDGLQHYALGRDLELVVVDGHRRFGNGWRLPAGPLRESTERLATVYAVVCNGGQAQSGEIPMRLVGDVAVNLHTHQQRPLAEMARERCAAMAGIGAPQRFFDALTQAGLSLQQCRAWPDHHDYAAANMPREDGVQWLMTEKDAIKCRAFAQPNLWYVPVDAELPAAFLDQLCGRVDALIRDKERGREL